MRIEWLPRALHDRDSQLAFVAERDPRAAIAMGDAIDFAVAQLAAHPRIGRPGRVAGSRELVISGTLYILADRITAETAIILRMLHGAQRWPRELQ